MALASIGMGAFLAGTSGAFNGQVFALCALTTIFLQVLSNLANDYGDSIHGADSAEREGPSRAVQTGAISKAAMKRAIMIFVLLSLVSGVALIYVAFGWMTFNFLLFLGIGALAIVAAITYTAGYRPYGYAGLGDISVLIFFGFVAVMGSAYLYEGDLNWDYVLPAISVGFFSVGVLNVNNIRDIQSDEKAGKRSIPVRLGRPAAVKYHWFLLIAGITSSIVYVGLNYASITQLIFVLSIPLFMINGRAVSSKTKPADLDPFLKQMALSTLLYVVLFGIGQLL